MNYIRLLLLLFVLLGIFIFMQNEKTKSQHNKVPLSSAPKSPSAISSDQKSEIGSTTDMSFIYPQAKKIHEDTFMSNDTPEQITTWYKNLFRQAGYQTTNFVMTRTNNAVQNTLVGEKGSVHLQVQIIKGADENSTKITLTGSPS